MEVCDTPSKCVKQPNGAKLLFSEWLLFAARKVMDKHMRYSLTCVRSGGAWKAPVDPACSTPLMNTVLSHVDFWAVVNDCYNDCLQHVSTLFYQTEVSGSGNLSHMDDAILLHVHLNNPCSMKRWIIIHEDDVLSGRTSRTFDVDIDSLIPVANLWHCFLIHADAGPKRQRPTPRSATHSDSRFLVMFSWEPPHLARPSVKLRQIRNSLVKFWFCLVFEWHRIFYFYPLKSRHIWYTPK